MAYQCRNIYTHPGYSHDMVAVAHTACSACVERGNESDSELGPPEQELKVNSFPMQTFDRSNDFGHGFEPNRDDSSGIILRDFGIPSPPEAAFMLASAEEIAAMAMVD